MLWLISLALSPLEVARNAVTEGDADGDDQLNAAEFKSMMHESHAFRKAVFTALDQDKDGMLDAEPFQQLEAKPRAMRHPSSTLTSAQAFELADADHDELLDAEEAGTYHSLLTGAEDETDEDKGCPGGCPGNCYCAGALGCYHPPPHSGPC